MSYTLIVKEEARLDMLEAYLYYEEELTGLGERFLSSILTRFSEISEHPEYYSFIDNRQILRDVTVDNFPFVIIYEKTDESVIVYAVFSTYKRPRH